jgi:hypothetical protein
MFHLDFCSMQCVILPVLASSVLLVTGENLAPPYPTVPFIDCGSPAFKLEAAYFSQLNATTMINGFAAVPLREISNATQIIEVYYGGQKVYNDSFDACKSFPTDGFPKCPWTPRTHMQIIDVNPVHPPNGPYTGKFIFVDSKAQQLMCLQTNWSFH